MLINIHLLKSTSVYPNLIDSSQLNSIHLILETLIFHRHQQQQLQLTQVDPQQLVDQDQLQPVNRGQRQPVNRDQPLLGNRGQQQVRVGNRDHLHRIISKIINHPCRQLQMFLLVQQWIGQSPEQDLLPGVAHNRPDEVLQVEKVKLISLFQFKFFFMENKFISLAGNYLKKILYRSYKFNTLFWID